MENNASGTICLLKFRLTFQAGLSENQQQEYSLKTIPEVAHKILKF